DIATHARRRHTCLYSTGQGNGTERISYHVVQLGTAVRPGTTSMACMPAVTRTGIPRHHLHDVMNLSLVSTAAAIGLAGGVHCIAMCASPAALATRINGTVSFQAGRVTGYALLGAVAALGAASFSNVATAAAWMRPIWIMLHVAIVF